MTKIYGVEEFNLVGIVITLVLVVILLALFPFSNRRIGDVFVRLTTILSQSVRVNVVKRKLLLPTSYRGTNTEISQQAEEYIAAKNQALSNGEFAPMLRRELGLYNPLVYFPFLTQGEKRFEVLQPILLFKWVMVVLAIYIEWFVACITVYVFQAVLPNATASFGVPLCLLLAVISACVAQPCVFLLIWGFHCIYLRLVVKLFGVYTGKTGGLDMSPVMGRNNRSICGSSVVLDIHSLNSTSRRGFLADAAAERSARRLTLDPEPFDRSSVSPSPHKELGSAIKPTATSTPEDDGTFGEDANDYVEGGKKNDGGLIEKFTVVACGIIIFMGMFSGFTCFAISADAGSILFVTFAFEFIFDTFILRVIICIVLALIGVFRQRHHKASAAGDAYQPFFLTRRDQQAKEAQQQLTEMAKLMPSPGAKVYTQTGPFVVQEESNASPALLGQSAVDPAKQPVADISMDPAALEDEEKCWTDINATAKTLDDYNRFLLRRIYATYDMTTSDRVVKNWRDPATTDELQEKRPENDVWIEAQEQAELEYSQRRGMSADKSRLSGIRLDSRFEDEKDAAVQEEQRSAEMSFTEPPNIGGGDDQVEETQAKRSAVMMRNIGIKGQINPRLTHKLDPELVENLDEFAPPADLVGEIFSPKSAQVFPVSDPLANTNAPATEITAANAKVRGGTATQYAMRPKSKERADAVQRAAPNNDNKSMVVALNSESTRNPPPESSSRLAKEVAVISTRDPAMRQNTSERAVAPTESFAAVGTQGNIEDRDHDYRRDNQALEQQHPHEVEEEAEATAAAAQDRNSKETPGDSRLPATKQTENAPIGAEHEETAAVAVLPSVVKGRPKDKSKKLEKVSPSKAHNGEDKPTVMPPIEAAAKVGKEQPVIKTSKEERKKLSQKLPSLSNVRPKGATANISTNTATVSPTLLPGLGEKQDEDDKEAERSKPAAFHHGGREDPSAALASMLRPDEDSTYAKHQSKGKEKMNMQNVTTNVRTSETDAKREVSKSIQKRKEKESPVRSGKAKKGSPEGKKRPAKVDRSLRMLEIVKLRSSPSHPDLYDARSNQRNVLPLKKASGTRTPKHDNAGAIEEDSGAYRRNHSIDQGELASRPFQDQAKLGAAMYFTTAYREKGLVKPAHDSEMQTDLQVTPGALRRKQMEQLSATSGLNAVQIDSQPHMRHQDNIGDIQQERREEDQREAMRQSGNNWSEKKKQLREQVFDLADMLDKKTRQMAKRKATRKLRSQVVRRFESPAKRGTKDVAIEGSPVGELARVEPDREGDANHSDSAVIEAGQVEFDGNFAMSEGGEQDLVGANADDVIYYPKDDLTNYSKNRGLNRVQARVLRHIDENEQYQSDTDIFAQIEQSMLQPYNPGRIYESDQERDKAIQEYSRAAESVIMEEPISENANEDVLKELKAAKRLKRVRSIRGSTDDKLSQTARQFQRPLIKKSISQTMPKRRRRVRHDRVVFNRKMPSEESKYSRGRPLPDTDSPYKELLFKRYREYHPDEAVSIPTHNRT